MTFRSTAGSTATCSALISSSATGSLATVANDIQWLYDNEESFFNDAVDSCLVEKVSVLS
jgi:hypothetical protein